MSCHVCSGNPLQSWTKVVAVFQIFRSVFTLVRGIIFFSTGAELGDDHLNITTVKEEKHGNLPDNLGLNTNYYQFERTTTTKTPTVAGYVVLGSVIFSILEGISTLILSVVLYYGASNGLWGQCWIWLVGQYVLIIPGFLFLFFVAGLAGMAPKDTYHNSFITAIGLGINVYCIWLVHQFIQELGG